MSFFLLKIVLERKHHLLKMGMLHRNAVVWIKLLLQSFTSSRRNFGIGFQIAVIWNDHMKQGKTRPYLCSKAEPASSSSLVIYAWLGATQHLLSETKTLMVSASFQHGIKPNTEGSIFQSNPTLFSQPFLLWSFTAQSWGGLNSYPDSSCQRAQWEKGLCVTLRLYSINRNNTWQVWLFGLTHKTQFIINQTQIANCAQQLKSISITTISRRLQGMITVRNATSQPTLILFFPFCCQREVTSRLSSLCPFKINQEKTLRVK